ncbi:MAG: Cystathionine beta-synthase, partial [uncultured Corynebacteriales bacterium]
GDAVRALDGGPHRRHPARPTVQGHRGPGPAGAGEGRVLQPRRLGEGPDRAADDRGGRTLRRAPPRRHHRRAHQRKHRCRAGDRGPDPGLPVRVRLPGQGLDGQDQRAQGVRRGGRGLPDRRRARAPGLLLQRLGPAGPGDRRGLEAQPVREPGERRLALRDHRAGDVGADRGADDPLRDRARHRRDGQRRGPLPQGGLAGTGAGDRRRPGGLGLLRRHRPAVPGRGGRRGLLALDVRQGHLRRDRPGQRRGLVRDDPAAGPRGGPAGRRLVRDGGGGGAAGGRAGLGRRRRRGAAARRRPRLPVEDLQRRLDGRLRLPAHLDGDHRGRRAAPQDRRDAGAGARAPAGHRAGGDRHPPRVRRLADAGGQGRAAGDDGRGRRVGGRAGPAGAAVHRPGPARRPAGAAHVRAAAGGRRGRAGGRRGQRAGEGRRRGRAGRRQARRRPHPPGPADPPRHL